MQPSNHQVSFSQKQNMIRHSVVRASDQIKEGHGFESHLGSDSFPSLHFMQKTYHILKLRRFFYLTRSIQRITRLRRIILLQCEIAIETHFLLSMLLALPNRPPPPLSTSKQFVGNGQKLVQTSLLFPSFCEMKLEVKEHRGLFMTSQK